MTIYIPIERLDKNLSKMNKVQVAEEFDEYISLIDKSKTYNTDVLDRINLFLVYGKNLNLQFYIKLDEQNVTDEIENKRYANYKQPLVTSLIKKIIDITYGRYNATVKTELVKIPRVKENTIVGKMVNELKSSGLFDDYTEQELLLEVNNYQLTSVVDTVSGKSQQKLIFVLTDENSRLPFMPKDDDTYRMIIDGSFNHKFLKGENMKNIKAKGKTTVGYQQIKDTKFDYENKTPNKNGLYHHIESNASTTWWAFSDLTKKKLFVSSASNLIMEDDKLDYIYKHVYFNFSFLKKYSII